MWLNGQSLGSITGAFIRGAFDVTDIVKPEEANVLAVRVSPPPHPGNSSRTIRERRAREKMAASCVSMARRSSPPKAGIGFPPFAIATPASGNRSPSPQPAQ